MELNSYLKSYRLNRLAAGDRFHFIETSAASRRADEQEPFRCDLLLRYHGFFTPVIKFGHVHGPGVQGSSDPRRCADTNWICPCDEARTSFSPSSGLSSRVTTLTVSGFPVGSGSIFCPAVSTSTLGRMVWVSWVRRVVNLRSHQHIDVRAGIKEAGHTDDIIGADRHRAHPFGNLHCQTDSGAGRSHIVFEYRLMLDQSDKSPTRPITSSSLVNAPLNGVLAGQSISATLSALIGEPAVNSLRGRDHLDGRAVLQPAAFACEL